ncbi:MAG TPA: hypothetical protein VHH33_05525 [Nitrososphaeraceae archaeon]|nr:hypothetical protein [Nitrososphaeraceae archaeon]
MSLLTTIIVVISLVIVSSSTTLGQTAFGQSQEQQLQALLTAFLDCGGVYQQLGPLNMPAIDQYVCGGNMQNSFDALRYLSVTRDGLMAFATYSPYTKDLAFQAAWIIAPYTTNTPVRVGDGGITSPGQGSGPNLTDEFLNSLGGQTGADFVNGNENYNPQLGTQVQCTATGTCVDVDGGVNAALDPTTNQPVDVGAFGIPPGSNLQELIPAPMSPGE